MEAKHAVSVIGRRGRGAYDRLDGGLDVRLLFILNVGDVWHVHEDASGLLRMNDATFETIYNRRVFELEDNRQIKM